MNWILTLNVIFIFKQCICDNFLFPSQRNLEIEKWKRCSYLKTHGMLAVDCNDLDLFEIPTNLRSTIEVLDVTFNRIRELHNTSFENYPYLRILYLTDNSIAHIEAGAFAPIPKLEILDLTLNSLHVLPQALESLPALKKLMLGNNPFIDVIFTKTLPSVQYLSLSSCKLKKFPDFSALPGLVQLNISGNWLQTIYVTDVAPMCSLKLLDLTKNQRLFRKEFCNCQVLAKWFRNLSADGFDLLPEIDSLCKNTTEGKEIITDPEICFTNMTNILLEQGESVRRLCEAEVMKYAAGALRLKESARWVIIVLVSLAVIFVSAFCLYYVRRRQVRLKSCNHEVERFSHSKSRS